MGQYQALVVRLQVVEVGSVAVGLVGNAVTGPITYQGEEVRGSPTYVNNSANAWKQF